MGMRKISQTRSRGQTAGRDQEQMETRPQRIAGSTVTGKPARDLDLTAYFLQSCDWTLSGSLGAGDGRPTMPPATQRQTLALSDGTEITFKTID